MGIVCVGFTMSLDGYIAGPNDDVSALFCWYFGGDVEIPVPGSQMVFRVSPPSVEVIQSMLSRFGAMVTGRRDFDVSGAWGGQSPLNVPTFIVTHSPPHEWDGPHSPFTFVTDGVESALARARQAAGEKDIAISGTTITRQLLNLGLVDEIHIDLAPILLGGGIKLFDQLDIQVGLERTRLIEADGVTHLTFRVNH